MRYKECGTKNDISFLSLIQRMGYKEWSTKNDILIIALLSLYSNAFDQKVSKLITIELWLISLVLNSYQILIKLRTSLNLKKQTVLYTLALLSGGFYELNNSNDHSTQGELQR